MDLPLQLLLLQRQRALLRRQAVLLLPLSLQRLLPPLQGFAGLLGLVQAVLVILPQGSQLFLQLPGGKLAALQLLFQLGDGIVIMINGILLDRPLFSIEGASGKTVPKQSAPQAPSVGRMVDREAKRAEGKGIGYDRWASMHNLKAWSKTFMYLQEHDLLSPDKLSAAVDAAGTEARDARSRYDAAAAKVTDKKAMLEAMDNYRNTYPVIKEYRAIRKEKDRQKFYTAYEADFIINDAAKRQLDKLGAPKQLPKRKDVVAEIQSLVSQKNECYNDYREKSDRLHELMTMQRNYQMSMPQPKRGHSHEQER